VCLRFEHDGGGYTPKVPDTNHVWVALETYKNGVRYVDTYKSFSIPSATDNLTFILRYTSSRIEFEVRNKDTNTLLTSDYNDSSSVIPSLSSVKYFFWGIWSYGGGWFTYQSPTYIRLGNNPTNGGMNMTVDYWFIKDYTSPEPTASVGSEESYSACKVLTDSITLNRDVSSSGTCYTIGASNIVIDCNGHTITYSQSSAGYGIKNTGGYDGITIKNCKIIQGSTNSNSHAIYISSTAASDDNVIVNNEIKTYGDNCWGINHYTNSNSFNNNISFNKITTNGANSGGIYNYFIESGANFNNNIINTTSTAIYSDTSCTNIKIKNNQLIVRVSGYAIGIIADSDNPVIENNTIESVSGGIRLSQLDNANVSNDKITLTGSSGCGINLYSTTNSQFQDGYVNSTNGATEYYVKTDGSNQFRNTDFTESRKIYFYDSNTWFVYNDKDTGGVWLKTRVSAAATVTRTLTTWTQSLVQWTDSASGITVYYNLTDLLPNSYYNVYDNGNRVYSLQTDSNGALDFSISLDGSHEIKVKENNPPNSPTLNSPQDGSAHGETTITLNVTVTDPDGDVMNVSFYDASDNSLIGTDINVPSGSFATVTWSGLSDGLHQWYANVTDGSLTTQSTTWSFTVDTTPPTVNTNSAGGYVRGTVEINASVSDSGVGLKDNSCRYSIYTGTPSWNPAFDNFEGGASSGKCYYSWDTSGYSNGTTYYFNFRANDTLDNQGEGTAQSTVVCNDVDPTACQQACLDLGYRWLSSGNFESGNPYCCGDDNLEYYNWRKCHDSYACSSDDNDEACCSSPGNCVDSGICYSGGSSSHDVDGNGDDEYCNDGTWYDCYDIGDCDNDPTWLTIDGERCSRGECQPESCTSNDCYYCRKNGYVDCDNDGDGTGRDRRCCSDNCFKDEENNYAQGACDTNNKPICDSTSGLDMCVPSGACGFDPGCDSNDITSYVNDGDTTVDFDCDGDPDYCSGSIWYDCYDDNQCPSGYSCVNNDCVDATPPQYSLNSTNSTLAGSAVEHRLKWTDNVGLSGYIFNFCNGTCNTEWALPGFKRCRNITISSPINDYQYKLILNTTNFNYSYANDDGSDIRIVNASCGNGGVEVPYWIEKWNKTGESTIWFRGDNSSTTTYAIYYNNTQAESKSNGAKTFIFFDDFNNLNNWNNPYPSYYTITTVDGRSVLKMTYPSGSTSGHLAAKTPVSGIVNKEVVYSARWWGGNSDMDDTVGYGPSGTSKTYYAYQSLGDTSTSYGKHRVFLEGGSYVKGSVNAQSSWKTAKMWINTTSDVWGYYDGELLHGTGSLSHTTGYLRFDIDPDSTSRGMYYDWIFVKKYTTTEPTTTLGEEESSSWVSDPWTPFPSGGTSDWSNVTKIINSTPGAVIKWCVYANDTSNNWNITSCDNPFTYIATAPPYYFDPKVLPSSGSTYSPSQSYQFNATWIDLDGGTIDKVWLYANFSGNFENYLVTTRDGDEYYYNIPNLAAGTYSYKWYANDTDGNVNNSFPMTTYVVNKATPSGHQTVSPGWTVTYPTETTVTCYLDVGDTGTSLTLKRDGITVATGSQPSETVTLGYKSDGHTYTCEYPGSQNYTSTTLDTDILTVNKGTPSLTLSCTGSKYPDDPSCTASESNNGDNDCTYNLYVGGILEDSGSSISWSGDRGAGTYNVAYNTTGCTNYTNNEVTDSFTVSKGSLSGSITVNDVKYPNDLTVSTSDTNPGDSDVEYEVYCEEILIASSIGSTPCESGCSKDYAVGSYTCKLNTTSSTFANWTSNSSIATDSGNVNPGTLQLSISGGGTFTYPHKTTVFGSESNPGDNDVTYQLWRDSALVDSTEPWSETILLGVGTYVYRFNATGGQNWTANSTGVTTTVTITQNTSTQNYMNLTIGVGTLGTEGDREYEIGSSINVTGWFDSSAFVGGGIMIIRV